jgi:hypothetical protein
VTGGVPAVRLDQGQDLPGANVNMVTTSGTIQREAGSQDRSLEVGESPSFEVAPETFQIVRQSRHATNVTESGYTRNEFLMTSRIRSWRR